MMKKIFLANLIIASSFSVSLAEPGGSYILTGNEKSIEQIIKADMEQHPDLYKGESLNSYVAKFKQYNKIGKRKLAPHDELLFPETKASLKAKEEAQLQLFLGKWKYESEDNPQIWFIIEYKADGTFTVGKNEKPTYSGVWKMDDEYLKEEIKENHFRKLFSEEKKPTIKKIILISETELSTQVEGQKVATGKRVD